MLRHFTYELNQGPLSSREELLGDWNVGNCRRAVQLYLFEKKNVFLKPEEVLCPESYNRTGAFVVSGADKFSFELLVDGDIIYAEKIRNKDGKMVDKSICTFPSFEEYLIHLHTAVYTGEKDKEIWHGTFIEGSSCLWSLEKFLHFYRPVAAKRVGGHIFDSRRDRV
ncbi:MAG: hypothetical protein WC757_01710 [Candidatus Paceibacterota bacterium]|jgi:hypothetical protein